MPAIEHGQPQAGVLLATQQLVLLGTGSPQLYYRFVLHQRAATNTELDRAASRADYGLVLQRGGLVIRDGYDLMEWEATTPHAICFDTAPGMFNVTALWLPDVPHGKADMVISLFLTPTERPRPGDGWPFLRFDLRSTR